MALWKKLTLAILGTLIAITGGCLAWLDRLSVGMCAQTIIEQVPSPSGQLSAVVFQIDCGATSGFNSHVAIVPGDAVVSSKSELPKSFFVIDTNHGQAPEGKEHGPEVRLKWLSDEHLDIQHHKLARVIQAEATSDAVQVSYATFR